METIIPVICDRCREEGLAGEGPFTDIRGLLEFEPVKRRPHVNGWKEEHQRAFIAALALTGSPRQAAQSLGRWPSGAEQLRKGKGGRSFAEAWEAALELYREREFFRIKDNLADLARQQEQRDDIPLATTHLRALPPPSPPLPRAGEGRGEGLSVEEAWEQHGELWPEDYEPPVAKELTDALFGKFILKLREERKARLAGRIAEADFYLRQISFFEVALELVNEDTYNAFANLRRGDVHLTDIAETDGTRHLDRLRRRTWLELELERIGESPSALAGAPGSGPSGGRFDPDAGDSAQAERGEGEGRVANDNPLALDLFPRPTLKYHEGFATQPSTHHGPYAHPAEGYDEASWAELDERERRDAYEEQHARAAAEEQVKWEAEMLHWVERTKAGKLGREWD